MVAMGPTSFREATVYFTLSAVRQRRPNDTGIVQLRPIVIAIIRSENGGFWDQGDAGTVNVNVLSVEENITRLAR